MLPGGVHSNSWKFFTAHVQPRNYLYIVYTNLTTWRQLETYIEDSSRQIASIDNVMSVVAWFFLEMLSGVQLLTRTRYEVDIWTE